MASGAIAAVVVDAIGNTHGFGRVGMIENRLVGIKSREVYEVGGSLARKRSRGGSAPARVREQLGLATAALAAHPCC